MQIILNTEYFLVVLNLQGGLNIKLIESGSANEITPFGKLTSDCLYLSCEYFPKSGSETKYFLAKIEL